MKLEMDRLTKHEVFDIIDMKNIPKTRKYYEQYGHTDVKPILAEKCTNSSQGYVLTIVSKKRELTLMKHLVQSFPGQQ